MSEATRLIVLAVVAVLVDRVAQQKQALEREVVTLRGFLPICSLCKKIRGDDEQWQQLEQYISAHSSAQFTHSLCPDCTEKQWAAIDAAARLPRQNDTPP